MSHLVWALALLMAAPSPDAMASLYDVAKSILTIATPGALSFIGWVLFSMRDAVRDIQKILRGEAGQPGLLSRVSLLEERVDECEKWMTKTQTRSEEREDGEERRRQTRRSRDKGPS